MLSCVLYMWFKRQTSGILICISQITVAYLKDDELDEERTKTFRSLRWGVEYCISINVEGNGALSRSSVSPEKCLLLPEQGEQNMIVKMHSKGRGEHQSED